MSLDHANGMDNDSAEVHEVDKLSFVLRTPLQSGGGRGEARIACRTCCDKKVKLTFTQTSPISVLKLGLHCDAHCNLVQQVLSTSNESIKRNSPRPPGFVVVIPDLLELLQRGHHGALPPLPPSPVRVFPAPRAKKNNGHRKHTNEKSTHDIKSRKRD